ncbi:MAG TPA: hypothetical protein PL163_20375, partial [Leptospiraceae bacterium]|nr:hypothetical protein [Leptospiraceae bacterium]
MEENKPKEAWAKTAEFITNKPQDSDGYDLLVRNMKALQAQFVKNDESEYGKIINAVDLDTMDRDTTAEVTFNSYAVTVVQGYSAALQKLKSESPKEWHDNAVTGADSIVKMLNERNAVSTKHLPVIKKKSAKSKEISAKHRKNAVAFRDSFQYDKAKTEFTSAASYNSTDPFHKEITAMDLHLQSKSAAGWDKTSLLREAMLNDQDNKPIQKDSQPIISSYKAKGD